jgi:hypothetical protein
MSYLPNRMGIGALMTAWRTSIVVGHTMTTARAIQNQRDRGKTPRKAHMSGGVAGIMKRGK